MTTLEVHLLKPHPKQHSFITSTAKRKVICAGRRGGKTTGVGELAVQGMLAGRRVLEAAPTADQTTMFWTFCKQVTAPLISAGVVTKNETERLLQMANGGRIRTRTAYDADTLRGDYADLLILDEYSYMKPSAWDEVGAPMLLDNDGDAVFIFTPNRRNHAYHMYVRAQADDTGFYQAWHFTSLDNPFLSKKALAEITSEITEEVYKQEILAEFLASEGAVFRNIAACMTAPQTVPDEHKDHYLGAGVDWAKQQDYTTVSIVCPVCAMEVARDRFNKIDYHFQRDRIKALFDKWGVKRSLGESNSIGEPNLEELRRDGVHIRGFETTAQTKIPLIEALALALERETIRWQADPVWTAELEAYELKQNPNTGHVSYSAPEGVHDDTVIARALAWACVNRPSTRDMVAFV